MALPYYFRIPFGASGDRTTVPVTGTNDGPVNFEYGFGEPYSLPRNTNPAALTIPRVSFNQLLYTATAAIQQIQQFGVPYFITSSDNGGSPFSYSKNAIVRYDNGTEEALYMSLTDSNVELPTVSAAWLRIQNDPVYLTATQTLTNKTITSGRFNQINDTNGNAAVILTPTGSAVNHVGITNAATGNNPIIAAVGSDANINLNLAAKGTGNVRLIPGSGSNVVEIYNGAQTRYASLSVASLTASRVFTLPDATTTLAGTAVANSFTAQQGLGFGATFGNTARAGATVLDWYEEVNFSSTVAIAGSSSAGTASYSTKYGYARRVGDMVFFNIFLAWSSHTGTGNIRITGLPFTAAAIDQPVNVGYISDVAMTAGRFPGALVSGGSTTIFLYECNPAGAAAQVPIDAAGSLAISGMYLV